MVSGQPRLLIAVINCHSRDDWQQAIRYTWLALAPEGVDVRFFRGRGAGREPFADEVFLDCDDSYMGLPEKVQAAMKWGYDNGYDFMLKCDDDVVLDPVRLFNESGFEHHEYSGRGNRPPKNTTIKVVLNRPLTPMSTPVNNSTDHEYWVPYGFCYVVSRKCMELLIATKLPEGSNDDEKWVARTLHEKGISLSSNHKYQLVTSKPRTMRQRPITCEIIRPIKIVPHPEDPETLAWCVHLASHDEHHIGTEEKLSMFHHLFKEKVLVRKESAAEAV
jgi:Galactosyltransferase